MRVCGSPIQFAETHKVHAVLLPGIPDVRDFESPRSNPECLPIVEGKVACIGFGSLEQKT